MNTQEIKVSVIVPVYNVEEYLRRCVDSILAQTLQEIEIILVDDGSTDKSGRICDQLSNEHNILVIHQDNLGLTAARRAGIEKAKGEYIIFVDSDDYIDSKLCEEEYLFAKNNGYKLLIVDFNINNNDAIEYKKGYFSESISIKECYTNLIPGYVWNKMYHRSLINDLIVSINVSQAEDLCVVLPLLSNLNSDEEIGYLEKAYYYYYKRPNSSSNSVFFVETCAIDEYLQAISYILNKSNSNYKKEVSFYCIQALLWGINNPDRQCFKADYIDYMQNIFSKYVLGNDLLLKRPEIFKYLSAKLIPKRLIFCETILDTQNIKACRESWNICCKGYEFIEVKIDDNMINDAPKCVQEAFNNNNFEFIDDYYRLKYVKEHGGISLANDIKLNKPLGEERTFSSFLGYIDNETVGSGIFGACENDDFISKVFDTYLEDSIFNDTYLSLRERMQIVLCKYFKLIPKGKECFLMGNKVKLFTANRFYKRINKNNVAQLYSELDEKAKSEGKILLTEEEYDALLLGYSVKTVEKVVVDNTYKEMYENTINSNAWKLTAPLRKIMDIIKGK